MVVLATELGDANPGPSVTNAAEAIATDVLQRYALDATRMLFVAHSDERSSGTAATQRRDGAEDFDRVGFAVTADRDGRVRVVAPASPPLRTAAVKTLVAGQLSCCLWSFGARRTCAADPWCNSSGDREPRKCGVAVALRLA